ncbi:MAG: TIGR01459 family HAD-type hydrolase [Alphaproteobacteria bacterium]|nr:TIGR01459 family HAD-type hydrolase [Alphaproteobacteria bacterium]
MTTIPILDGLRAIAGRYDGFILDLWGVIHDGATAYPGAADTLAALRAAGKRVVLLSNAPRRAAPLVEGMRAMGIPRDLYDSVLSSGEVVHDELIARTDPWFAALGPRCLHIGPERDRNVLEGVAAELVDHPALADWVLNTGPVSLDETVADYEAPLAACAARGLPMVCANPDIEVIREGRRLTCAGALAKRYQALGGEVGWRGKPDPAVYRASLDQLGLEAPRVLVIGDALHTDVAGAEAAGIDALLITGGIHAEELGTVWGDPPDPARLDALAAKHGHRPVAALPAFRW